MSSEDKPTASVFFNASKHISRDYSAFVSWEEATAARLIEIPGGSHTYSSSQ